MSRYNDYLSSSDSRQEFHSEHTTPPRDSIEPSAEKPHRILHDTTYISGYTFNPNPSFLYTSTLRWTVQTFVLPAVYTRNTIPDAVRNKQDTTLTPILTNVPRDSAKFFRSRFFSLFLKGSHTSSVQKNLQFLSFLLTLVKLNLN